MEKFVEYLKFTIVLQISITIIALGYALVVVSTFGRVQAAALKKGFKDNIETYLLINGNFSSDLTQQF